jgi:hypothetical protein
VYDVLIYKTKVFNRWANKEGLSTASLCLAVTEMMNGLYEGRISAAVSSRSALQEQVRVKAVVFGLW